LARPLAIVSIWLIAVAFFGTAYIVAVKRRTSSFMSPTIEVLDFTGAFAVAAALSAVIALIFGGRKRWAVEATLSIPILIVAPIGGAYALFWLAPTLGRYLLGMSVLDFLSFRRGLLELALKIAKLTVPTGTVLGIMIGAIAGLFLVLALLAIVGQRRRLAFDSASGAGDSLANLIGGDSNLVGYHFCAFTGVDEDHGVVLAQREPCPPERIRADRDQCVGSGIARRGQLDVLLAIREGHHRFTVATKLVTRLVRVAEAEQPRP